MNKRLIAAASLAVALSPLAPASAATLQVVSGPTGARGVQIQYFGPVGQSFTAIDSTLTSFGFQFQTFNAGSANLPITFSLLAGEGLGGAVLSTQQLALPSNLPDRTGQFFDFAVPNLSVAIGQRYTAVFSSPTDRFGMALGPEYDYGTGQLTGGDAYAGGRAFFTRPSGFANCEPNGGNCDFNFRVTGTTAVAAVPEPASWAMMLGGFGLLGGVLRRRRATRAFA